MTEPTLFLLYSGTSEDGRGSANYAGRTTDKAKAKKHYEKCIKNPYSTGYVVILQGDKNHAQIGLLNGINYDTTHNYI